MLRFLEGFETFKTSGSATTHLARLYESVGGSTFALGDGMHDSVNGDCMITHDIDLLTTELMALPADAGVIGIGFRPNNLVAINAGDIPYIAFHNDDGEQLRMEFIDAAPSSTKPGGVYYKVRVVRGVTTLATSVQQFTFDITQDGWRYFEFKATIDDTVGSFDVEFIRPKKTVSQLLTWDNPNTGVDTQNQVSAGWNRIRIAMTTGNASRDVACDEIYAVDDTGAKNNDFLGRLIIENQNPSGNGTTNQWVLAGGAASLEDAWNEPSISVTEDDKRVTSDVTNDVSLATVSNVSLITDVDIIGVRQDLVGRMETTGSLTLHHRWRKTTGSPAETDSGSFVVDSTTLEGHMQTEEDDPNTATDWVLADLASYQHGVRNGG